MKHIKLVFAALAALMACATSAMANNTDAVTSDQLEEILSDAGLGPTMTEDAATGAPVANGTIGEIQFWVRALDCAGSPAACENLVFFANFNLGRDVTQTDYRVVNSFNDSQIFGRAYIIEKENQVGVDYVIELGGGVSPEHLTKNISRWADVISAFVEKFAAGAGA